MKALRVSDQFAIAAVCLAAAIFYLLYLPGMIAGWLRCGAVPVPPFIFSPLGFLNPLALGDTSGFGYAPGTTCAPETWATTVWMIALLAFGLAVLLTVWKLVLDWRQSDERFIREVMRREGLARPKEVREKLGEKAALKRAPTLRPQLARAVREDAAVATAHQGTDAADSARTKLRLNVQDAAVRYGHLWKQPVWITCEESIVLVGPPRSGKGFARSGGGLP